MRWHRRHSQSLAEHLPAIGDLLRGPFLLARTGKGGVQGEVRHRAGEGPPVRAGIQVAVLRKPSFACGRLTSRHTQRHLRHSLRAPSVQGHQLGRPGPHAEVVAADNGFDLSVINSPLVPWRSSERGRQPHAPPVSTPPPGPPRGGQAGVGGGGCGHIGTWDLLGDVIGMDRPRGHATARSGNAPGWRRFSPPRTGDWLPRRRRR